MQVNERASDTCGQSVRRRRDLPDPRDPRQERISGLNQFGFEGFDQLSHADNLAAAGGYTSPARICAGTPRLLLTWTQQKPGAGPLSYSRGSIGWDGLVKDPRRVAVNVVASLS